MRGEQQQVGDGWFSFSEEGGEHGEAAGRLDWLKESRQGHHTSEQPWAANLQRLHNRGSGGKGGGGGGGGARARAAGRSAVRLATWTAGAAGPAAGPGPTRALLLPDQSSAAAWPCRRRGEGECRLWLRGRQGVHICVVPGRQPTGLWGGGGGDPTVGHWPLYATHRNFSATWCTASRPTNSRRFSCTYDDAGGGVQALRLGSRREAGGCSRAAQHRRAWAPRQPPPRR